MGTLLWCVTSVYIVMCMLGILMRTTDTAASISLIPGQAQVVTLPQLGAQTFQVTGVESSVHYLLMQVHAQEVPLFLKSTFPPPAQSINGTSIGVVTFLRTTDTTASWDVSIDYSSTNHTGNVTAVVFVQQFDNNAPVPGGCNQVFELETDPNIKLFTLPYQTRIWFQLASIGYRRNENSPSCEPYKDAGHLQYNLYVAYMKESDHAFGEMVNTLEQMLTPDRIENYGYKILSVEGGGEQKSLISVTALESQGAVYAVVVRDLQNGTAASYVAAVTYSCDFATGACDISFGAVEIVLTVMCGVTGLFLLLLGHSFLKTELAVFGFIAVSLVSFTLLMLAGTLSDGVCLAVACVLGLVGALMWFGVWRWLAFPTVSVLLPGMTAGYLVSSTLFFSPFANLSWWESNLNYGLIFACVVLLFPVLLLWSPHTLNVVSCGLVGSFCVVMAAAIPLRSTLIYIILNSVHHATIPGYSSAVVVYPFQTNDIILAVLWGVLAVGGCSVQVYRQWGRDPFPGHPSLQAARDQSHQTSLPRTPSAPDHERAPLLGKQSPSNYDSYHTQLPKSELSNVT